MIISMKKASSIILSIVASVLIVYLLVEAAELRVFTTGQGGTGISTSTGISVGDVLTVSSTNPFLYKLTAPTGGCAATTTINNFQSSFFTLQGTAGQINVVNNTGTSTWSFATTTISQWINDASFITSPVPYASTTGVQATLTFPLAAASTTDNTSFPIGIASTTGLQATISFPISVASTSLAQGEGIDLTGNVLTLDMLGGICNGTDKISAISATGTIICSEDTQGAGTFTTTTINGLSTTAYTFTEGAGITIATSVPGTVTFGTTGLQTSLSFPLAYASTTHIAFPIPYASTTGFSFATNGLSGLSIASSSGAWTFTIATATVSQSGFLSSADWGTFNSKITTTSLSVAYAPLVFNQTTGVFSLPTSTASQSGFLSSGDWGIFNSKQNAISFPIPVASTSLAVVSPLVLTTNSLSMPTSTASVNGYLSATNWATFNAKITTTSLSSTATGLTYNNGTGAFSLTAGYEIPTTASTTIWTTRNFNISVPSASTTDSGVAQKLFPSISTITEIRCSALANITIGADKRSSSTPATAGTDIFNGGSLVCDSDGNSTTTFANAGMAAGDVFNLDIDAITNTTTTLQVFVKYTQ